MFKLTYTTPYEGEIKTLKLTRNPSYYGLGHYTDVDGVIWDVHSIFGNVLNARPVDNSPYYSTANDGHSFGNHEWIPYFYEVINKK